MTKAAVAATTLDRLVSLLHEQSEAIASLRADLAVQFTRTAQIQAELDMLRMASERRPDAMRARLLGPPPVRKGNGHGAP